MKSSNEFIEIGKITKTKGLKGELQIYSLFDAPERFEGSKFFIIEGERFPLTLCRLADADRLRVKFRGVDSIDAAQLLVGKEVSLPLDELPRYEDEYFDFELTRLEVQDTAGQKLGRITQVVHTGAKDVYEITGEDGHSWMIPATHDFVPVIDLERGIVVVAPLPGMINIDDAE